VRLGDRYELGEVLGRGGMATVYRATDTVLDRSVAVKLLAARYAGDERFVERFRREAQASARLNHPNIVSVFDTGDQDGSHYIVMEVVEGQTLAEVMRREERLSPERSARIAGDIALALQAAHREGIVHRDVKPGNIMITREGEVKVMDFGIARAAEEDQLTQTGVVLGTAAYLSPEQSRGDPVDARSDVYSLGCVLREMLTGAPPFTGDTPVAIAYKHVHQRPEPPSADDPRVPPELDAVVMRALEKDPARRHPSAEAFRTALGQAAAGVPTEPIRQSGGDTAILPASAGAAPSEEPPARRRWWPAVAAFALAALVVVVAFALTGDDRPRDRAERREQRRQERAEPQDITEITDLTGAVTHLEETVQRAVAEGGMTEELGAAVLEEVDQSLNEYRAGDLTKALDHLGHADDAIDQGLEQEAVAAQSAEATKQALVLVGGVMEAAPPEPVEQAPEEGAPSEEEESDGSSEGCEGGGPGNSECAAGHQKKDGDDEDD
jgi:tRNA A-37 threonylcarbamoyl transferase component Bud32